MTDGIVALFLLAPLVVVPLGYRLLEVAAPGSRPPGLVLAAALPAAVLLFVAFRFTAGPTAAVLALPWFAVTGLTALSAGARILRDQDRFRPSARHVSAAAAAFLSVGAFFAVMDRLGVRPLDLSATVILLTAVHFHYAGFVLPLAGALAFRLRPTGWLAVALCAVVVGIPITALGFVGVPFANWVGAILTAAGGFGIGIATIVVAGGLATWPARVMAMVAGASLLISMPMAVIYATGTAHATAWIDVETMTRLHGVLNALGFALPVTLAWTLDRRARDALARPARRLPASPGRRWLTGLTVGLVVGVGILVGGPLVGLAGIGALLVLAWEPGRDAPIGGLLSGFSAAWLLLFLRADLSCQAGCEAHDLTPWYSASVAMLLIGAVLTARALRSATAGRAL